MWGTGTDDNGTIPAIFNQLNPQYRVFNHGESAFYSRQNLARLINLYAMGERTDLVVFYNGNNHFNTGCHQSGVLKHSREDQIKQMVRNSSVIHGSIFRQIFLQYTLQLIPKLQQKLGLRAPASLKMSPRDASLSHRADNCADIMIRIWQMAFELVKSQGGQFIAVLQPLAVYGNARIDHLDPHVVASNKKSQTKYQAFYDALRRKMREYEYMYDMSDAFDGDAYIFIDQAHVSRPGNEIIASKLTRIVTNLSKRQ